MDHHMPGGAVHGNPVATTAYEYEPHRDHKTVVSNHYNSSDYGYNHISSYEYTYDPIGRHGSAIGPDVVTNAFGYNRCNEVSYALMGSNLSTYAYDNIGNRRTATQFDGAHPYTANSLNQYPEIVTDGAITNTPQHGLDGNQHQAPGRHHRHHPLRLRPPRTACPQDHRNRQHRHQGPPFPLRHWNLALQHDADQGATTHTWGLDLSQSQQGAGGIGGLLSVHTPQRQFHRLHRPHRRPEGPLTMKNHCILYMFVCSVSALFSRVVEAVSKIQAVAP